MNNIPDQNRFNAAQIGPFFEQNLVDTGVLEHHSGLYEYGLINTDSSNVHLACGMPNGNNLFISNRAEEPFLSFYLAHEIECCRLRAAEACRCAAIEREAFESLDPALQAIIYESRLKTFADLVEYYRMKNDPSFEILKANIAATHDWLKSVEAIYVKNT